MVAAFNSERTHNAVGTVVNYTYGNTNWKDLLTAYNGNAITYDAIGNPLTYYNGTTFTWERGRKLATATTADGTAISYKYNDSGIRTQKTVNGVATDYFLDGSKIIAEKTNGNTTWYYYDGDGTREAIEYKGNVYYYFYNAQGDVMGLYDNNLNVVVNYTYDSWGNVVSVTGSMADTLGQDNPFRYRGYYFDSDTGLYYLNSRYYDAQTGRFINADGMISTGQGILDKNMFVYCFNNPIILCDPSGCQPDYYVVTYPAEGDGPVTITSYADYTFNLSKSGNTYTLSATKGKVKNPVDKADNLIQTFYLTASDGAVERDFAIINAATTLKSGNSYLKSIGSLSSNIGYASAALTGMQVIWDYQNYGHDAGLFMKATGITLASTMASITWGSIVSTVCASALIVSSGFAPVIGLGLVVGGSLLISHCEDKARQYYLGETETYYVY